MAVARRRVSDATDYGYRDILDGSLSRALWFLKQDDELVFE